MYPVLQAADILLYKASKVPVGEDNLQNVEMARRLARLFNNRFGVEVFPEPEPVLAGSGARIRSLRNPAKKMSKSDEVGSTLDSRGFRQSCHIHLGFANVSRTRGAAYSSPTTPTRSGTRSRRP